MRASLLIVPWYRGRSFLHAPVHGTRSGEVARPVAREDAPDLESREVGGADLGVGALDLAPHGLAGALGPGRVDVGVGAELVLGDLQRALDGVAQQEEALLAGRDHERVVPVGV